MCQPGLSGRVLCQRKVKAMKIAITATQGSLEAQVDPRFGRCACFLIVETDDLSYEIVENPNAPGWGRRHPVGQVDDPGGLRYVLPEIVHRTHTKHSPLRVSALSPVAPALFAMSLPDFRLASASLLPIQPFPITTV